MAKLYDEYEKEQLEKAAQQAANYGESRRTQANVTAAGVADVYNTAIENARAQYEASAGETADSYRSLYDTNVVNELIARRHAEEAIANAGLKKSGLNATHQTAISLQRGRADYQTTAQKQQAVDAIMRELDNVRTEYQTASAKAQADIHGAADVDISAARVKYDQAAYQTAASLYGMQQEAEQKKADRDHDLYMMYLDTMREQGATVPQYINPGTVNAEDNIYSLFAVRENARAIKQREGDVGAENYLNQFVNRGHITDEQRWQLMNQLGIRVTQRIEDDSLKKMFKRIKDADGVSYACDHLHTLYESGVITADQVRQVYDQYGIPWVDPYGNN